MTGSSQPSYSDPPMGRLSIVRLALSRFEGWMGGLSLFLCLTVVSTEILLRGVFNISLLWSEELARYLLIWTTYWGATAVTADNAHIRVEMLINFLGKGPRRLLEAIILLGCASGTAMFAWYGYILVADSRNLGLASGDSSLPVPIWIFQSVIPVAFALMTVRILLTLAHLIRHGEMPKAPDELVLEV